MLRLATLVLLATTAVAGTPEGKAALEKKDYATALKEFTAAAEAGDAEAHYQLGEIYRRGLGVRANPRLAAKSYEAGAALGHKGAAGEFGIHLWKTKKRDLAVARLRDGVEGGHMRSQYWLAMLDYKGAEEVDLTDERRTELFRAAAEQGHPDAASRIATSLKKENPEEAEKWYRKAAEQGHSSAYMGLAHILMDRKRTREALETFKKAALGGEYLAQHFLALANLKFERFAESYAWASVGSTPRNAWPEKSKIIQKLYKGYAKSLKDMVKGAKKYTKPHQIKEGKALAKEYLKQIKATLKAGPSWEEPDV